MESKNIIGRKSLQQHFRDIIDNILSLKDAEYVTKYSWIVLWYYIYIYIMFYVFVTCIISSQFLFCNSFLILLSFHFLISDRVRSELFLELPSRFEYPDYYDIIKTPIDFFTIKVSISAGTNWVLHVI